VIVVMTVIMVRTAGGWKESSGCAVATLGYGHWASPAVRVERFVERRAG
jgi:hypothetical protein